MISRVRLVLFSNSACLLLVSGIFCFVVFCLIALLIALLLTTAVWIIDRFKKMESTIVMKIVSLCCMIPHLAGQVDRALEEFWRSLRPAGPDLSKGWIAVSFFMRRVSE